MCLDLWTSKVGRTTGETGVDRTDFYGSLMKSRVRSAPLRSKGFSKTLKIKRITIKYVLMKKFSVKLQKFLINTHVTLHVTLLSFRMSDSHFAKRTESPREPV